MANLPFQFFLHQNFERFKTKIFAYPRKESWYVGTMGYPRGILGVSSGYLLQQNRYAYGVKKVKYLNLGIVYLQKKQ